MKLSRKHDSGFYPKTTLQWFPLFSVAKSVMTSIFYTVVVDIELYCRKAKSFVRSSLLLKKLLVMVPQFAKINENEVFCPVDLKLLTCTQALVRDGNQKRTLYRIEKCGWNNSLDRFCTSFYAVYIL